MYKIYINMTPIFLIDPSGLSNWPAGDDKSLSARYTGKPKFLFNYIDMLEKSNRFDSVILYSETPERLWADFQSHFRIVEAAGGVVYNEKNEVLLIFRLGHWDLPKGKIDEGESPEMAASREVREETGLERLGVENFIGMTYHTYRDSGQQRVLKKTYWYRMHTADSLLRPQTEENIEKAVWMDLDDFFSVERVVYGNIRDLLQEEREKRES